MEKQKILYATAEEQIEKLKRQGLIIDDPAFAKAELELYGYSNLIKSYRAPYTIVSDEGKKTYRSGITFEQVLSLYILDKNLRNAVMASMLDLEEHVKEAAADIIARKYGTNPDDYLQFRNYVNKKKRKYRFSLPAILDKLKEALDTDKDPIAHYSQKYGAVPPWILFKSIYFSTIVNFINLFKPEEQLALAEKLYDAHDLDIYGKSLVSLMLNTLFICIEYRNLSAHGGRVYNYIPKATVKLQQPDTLLPFAEDIYELTETQGLPLLLNTLSLLSYKEPFKIIDRALREELNRHLTLYEKDVDILSETLNLTLYKDQPNCMIIDGKEYTFISRIQSGLPGVKLIDAPDDLIKLLSNSPSDNTDN